MPYRVGQVAEGGEIPDGFDDEGFAQDQATGRRTAVAHPTIGLQIGPQRAKLENGNEFTTPLVEFAQLVLKSHAWMLFHRLPRLPHCGHTICFLVLGDFTELLQG